jgi:hypothetical protein
LELARQVRFIETESAGSIRRDTSKIPPATSLGDDPNGYWAGRLAVVLHLDHDGVADFLFGQCDATPPGRAPCEHVRDRDYHQVRE